MFKYVKFEKFFIYPNMSYKLQYKSVYHPSDWIPLCIVCIDKEGWGFSPGNILITRVEKEKD